MLPFTLLPCQSPAILYVYLPPIILLFPPSSFPTSPALSSQSLHFTPTSALLPINPLSLQLSSHLSLPSSVPFLHHHSSWYPSSFSLTPWPIPPGSSPLLNLQLSIEFIHFRRCTLLSTVPTPPFPLFHTHPRPCPPHFKALAHVGNAHWSTSDFSRVTCYYRLSSYFYLYVHVLFH